MHPLDRFKEFVRKEKLFQPGDHLLLAVSGGVDSVVLCELCHQAGYSFAIAHCNFRLRGEESERDKEFVRTLAGKYGVNIFVKDFDTAEYASTNKLSTQEAARNLRYQWFHELLDISLSNTPTRTGPNSIQSPKWILTAHHADDNVETVVMNFFRGTGIQGLRGIQPKQGKLVRPLLPFRKVEMLDLATHSGLHWVEDSSNQTDKYSRNLIRHQLIPVIQQIYPEAEANLINNIQRFREIELLYKQALNLHFHKLLEHKNGEVHLPVLKLKKMEPLATIVHAIIQQYGFTTGQVHDVLKLIDSESGKYIQSNSHRIMKNRNWLVITPVLSFISENILINESDSKVLFAAGELHFETVEHVNLDRSPDTAQLNAELLQFPLLLRKWKTGDYFYPLGMKKKKKVSRFLIDQKKSRSEKEAIWVLEMNKKIVWVVGMRIDDRFKVGNFSKPALLITLKRKQSPK